MAKENRRAAHDLEIRERPLAPGEGHRTLYVERQPAVEVIHPTTKESNVYFRKKLRPLRPRSGCGRTGRN